GGDIGVVLILAGGGQVDLAVLFGLFVGDVEHVVQAGGDEQALQSTKYEHTKGASIADDNTQTVDAHRDGLPDEGGDQAHNSGGQDDHQGHKPFAAVEGNGCGEGNFVVFVVQGCGEKAGNDTCHSAHVHSLNTQDHGDLQGTEVHESG